VEDLVTDGPDGAFWRGRHVLLTGHTGFKGAWLALWLQRLGAQVTGVALAPDAQPNLFTLAGVATRLDHHVVDIRDADALATVVRRARPEVVLHLAAQALVRPSYDAPAPTFAVNCLGTVHLLDALRGLDSVRVVLVATTDKVYRNREDGRAFVETDELGGHDPYSASKAAAEVAIASYRDAFLAAAGVAVASVRAGNVIGGGDWARDRLLPDAMRAWGAGATLQVRRPDAVRPWQHVLQPLHGYLRLVEALWQRPSLAGAYNSGPDASQCAPVRSVLRLAQLAHGSGELDLAQHPQGVHEAGVLLLDSGKLHSVIGAAVGWRLEQAVFRTVAWYRAQRGGADAARLCSEDIDAFEAMGRDDASRETAARGLAQQASA
jgi:CDP-glucose 4,6-dehydratase